MSMTPKQIADEMRHLAELVETTLILKEEPPENEILVQPGGDIQAALQSLQSSGGTVLLVAGGQYDGPVYFPERTSGPLITLKTQGTLPERRIAPADDSLLATITAANPDGCLRFENTCCYEVDGVRLAMTFGTHEVIVIQDSQDITLDRILFINEDGIKRIVRMNGEDLTVKRSHLFGGAWQGQDSQAICCWEGKGPYTITNNYLAASGENILFGGADNYLHNGEDNPSDILIANNHIHKPLEWKNKPGSVKNLLELKNATRALITDNLLENNWADAQAGYAILFTPMNQDGRAPWTVTKDIKFTRNYVKNVKMAINMHGYGYMHVTQQSKGIEVSKNVFESESHYLQAGGEMADLAVFDNVADNGYNFGSLYYGDVCEVEGSSRPAEFSVNQLMWNRDHGRDVDYGIHSEVGIGTAALEGMTNHYEFQNNKLVNKKYNYPPTTESIDEATFQAAKAALLQELGY